MRISLPWNIWGIDGSGSKTKNHRIAQSRTNPRPQVPPILDPRPRRCFGRDEKQSCLIFLAGDGRKSFDEAMKLLIPIILVTGTFVCAFAHAIQTFQSSQEKLITRLTVSGFGSTEAEAYHNAKKKVPSGVRETKVVYRKAGSRFLCLITYEKR